MFASAWKEGRKTDRGRERCKELKFKRESMVDRLPHVATSGITLKSASKSYSIKRFLYKNSLCTKMLMLVLTSAASTHACVHLCYGVRWSRCGRRVLQEEEGDVPLVAQLHKVAALQRRLVQQLSVAGHYSYQVAEVDTHGHQAKTRRGGNPSRLSQPKERV